MAKNIDPATGEFDDGTWHQSAESQPTLPPEDLTRRKSSDLGKSDDIPVPPHNTIAGPDSTPPPFGTAGGKDTPDSDEAIPKPGTDGSDEWDVLPAPSIEKGHVIFGKYLLVEKIGQGGMGQVWRVENVPLDREVALKLIRPEFAQNKNGWLRFEREARLMAKIEHPKVVAVYALGRAQSLGYIEMEFVPGKSLEKYLKERKGVPVPLEWTAQLLDQLCSVLQKAHGHIDKKSGKVKPIIHRDLKPSNLILVDGLPDGQNLKVLDFGIAKMVKDEGSPELTGLGDFVGTPYYMSPEQIRGGVSKGGRGEIDGRSDLYSVGVLLYQLLTSSLPFTGRGNMEVLLAHLHHKPLPMKEANPDAHVPAQVERVVMSCLEKDPDLRPQSARELADRFRAAVAKVEPPVPVPRPWKLTISHLLTICGTLAAILILCGLALEGYRLCKTTLAGMRKNDSSASSGSGSTVNAGVAFRTPRGYEPIDADKLKSIARMHGDNPEPPTAQPGDSPAGLIRNGDGHVFYYFAKGVYLPLGYRPENPKNLDGFWPSVLIRDSDQARFIRISGGRFTRGDFRSLSPSLRPAADLEDNDCTAHKVEVSGFYIQDTEVTNREIKDFRGEFSENKLDNWKKSCELLAKVFKRSEIEVSQSPAVCIDRATAQKYAQWVQGRLPTEAEWEYAARSRGQKLKWSWKGGNAKKGAPKAHVLPEAALSPYPLPVQSYKGEDETDEHVFDMTGNVREWCLDVYKPYVQIIAENRNKDQPLHDAPDLSESGSKDPDLKYVVRGGSYLVDPDSAMTFQRDGVAASVEANDLGFRVVLDCPGEPDETAE